MHHPYRVRHGESARGRVLKVRIAGLAVHGALAAVPAAGYERRHFGVDEDGGVGGDEAEGGGGQGQQLGEVVGDLGEEHACSGHSSCK